MVLSVSADAIEENLVETVDDFEEEIVVVAVDVGIAFAVVSVVEIAVVVEKAFAVASTDAADDVAVVAQKAVASNKNLEKPKNHPPGGQGVGVRI